MDRHTGRQTDGQANQQTDRQTGSQTDGQANQQTDRQTDMAVLRSSLRGILLHGPRAQGFIAQVQPRREEGEASRRGQAAAAIE